MLEEARGICLAPNTHEADCLKLPSGFDRWQDWTKTIKHMRVLLFFGQGVKNAEQSNATQQQAFVMFELWYFLSSNFLFFLFFYFLDVCLITTCFWVDLVGKFGKHKFCGEWYWRAGHIGTTPCCFTSWMKPWVSRRGFKFNGSYRVSDPW